MSLIPSLVVSQKRDSLETCWLWCAMSVTGLEMQLKGYVLWLG